MPTGIGRAIPQRAIHPPQNTLTKPPQKASTKKTPTQNTIQKQRASQAMLWATTLNRGDEAGETAYPPFFPQGYIWFNRILKSVSNHWTNQVHFYGPNCASTSLVVSGCLSISLFGGLRGPVLSGERGWYLMKVTRTTAFASHWEYIFFYLNEIHTQFKLHINACLR